MTSGSTAHEQGIRPQNPALSGQYSQGRACYRPIMADDVNRDRQERSAPDLQAQLARAYMSGNGAEVERLLTLIAEAQIVLPPKTRAAA
jgi:hypothetical protein